MTTTLDDLIDRADADLRTTKAERDILGVLRCFAAEAEDESEDEELATNLRRALDLVYGPAHGPEHDPDSTGCVTCDAVIDTLAECHGMSLRGTTAAEVAVSARYWIGDLIQQRDEARAEVERVEADLARSVDEIDAARTRLCVIVERLTSELAEAHAEIREACEQLAAATGRSVDDGGLADHVRECAQAYRDAVREIETQRSRADARHADVARITVERDEARAETLRVEAEASRFFDERYEAHAEVKRLTRERDEARAASVDVEREPYADASLVLDCDGRPIVVGSLVTDGSGGLRWIVTGIAPSVDGALVSIAREGISISVRAQYLRVIDEPYD